MQCHTGDSRLHCTEGSVLLKQYETWLNLNEDVGRLNLTEDVGLVEPPEDVDLVELNKDVDPSKIARSSGSTHTMVY